MQLSARLLPDPSRARGEMLGARGAFPSAAAGAVLVEPDNLALYLSYSLPAFVQRGTYRPVNFACKGCGKNEIWTPTQQKWWYEVAKGNPSTTATRCRLCRRKERERRTEARQMHLEGLARKVAKSG